MAKLKVYLESTIISFYANRRSKDIISAAYQEITSEVMKNGK
jgi:hypothetical protein